MTVPDPATFLEGILTEAEEAEAATADAAAGEGATATPDPNASPDGETTPANKDEGGQSAVGAEGLFDLLDGEQASTGPTIGSPEWFGLQVAVPDGDSVVNLSIKEMVDGNMMRADYTRKTQELASERDMHKRAIAFYNEFSEDPEAFGRKVAEAAGWIEAGQGKVANVSELVTQADVEKRIEEGIAARLAEHPDVVAAQGAVAQRAVDDAFSGIEKRWDLKLDDKNRERVLLQAQQSGTADLDLVFDGMMFRLQQIVAKRKAVKQTAGVTPGGTPTTEDDQMPELFDSFEDAFAAVALKLGDSASLI